MAIQIVSGNLNTLANAGTFEQDPTTWGFGSTDETRIAGTVDHAMKTREIRMAYLEPRLSSRYSDEDAQYEACERVVLDLISRMLRDKRGYNVGSQWVTLSIAVNSFRINPVEYTLGATRFIGYELRVDVMDNTNMAFNPANWH